MEVEGEGSPPYLPACAASATGSTLFWATNIVFPGCFTTCTRPLIRLESFISLLQITILHAIVVTIDHDHIYMTLIIMTRPAIIIVS